MERWFYKAVTQRIYQREVDTHHQPGSFLEMTSSSVVRKLKRIFLGMVGLLLVVGTAILLFLMYASYGEGYRVGNILKLSKKGVVFKTWEGELTQGFLEGTQDSDAGGVATRVWYFTVNSDSAVIDQINHAIDNNKKVKVFYKEKYTLLPWIGDTRQVVYKVEEVQ